MQNKTIYINKYSRPQGVGIIAESETFFVCRMQIGCDEYEPIFIQKQSNKYYNTFEEAYKECFEYKQTQKSEELKKEIEELEEKIKKRNDSLQNLLIPFVSEFCVNEDVYIVDTIRCWNINKMPSLEDRIKKAKIERMEIDKKGLNVICYLYNDDGQLSGYIRDSGDICSVAKTKEEIILSYQDNHNKDVEERIKELKIQESRSLENQKHYIERLAQIGQLKNLSKEEIKEKLLKTIEEILN